LLNFFCILVGMKKLSIKFILVFVAILFYQQSAYSQIFDYHEGKVIRTDTIKYSSKTVFVLKWYRLIGYEVPHYERSVMEFYLDDNDTIYSCEPYLVKFEDKTKNKYKIIFYGTERHKTRDDVVLLCLTDTSSINSLMIIPCGRPGKVKIKKTKKCENLTD
jgi:hypothetical protein